MMTSSINFSVAKLLDPANRDVAEQFNKAAGDYEDGLFSFDNTYNHIMLSVMFGSDPENGIWDAACSVDLERNLFIVVGKEGCSGFGATITAYFDIEGTLVEYEIKGTGFQESLEELVKTLRVDLFFVEPRTEENETAIYRKFKDVIEE